MLTHVNLKQHAADLAELHHLGLCLAPHVAPVMRDRVMSRDIVTLWHVTCSPMVYKQLVILEVTSGCGVCSLQLPHELSQLSPRLPHPPGSEIGRMVSRTKRRAHRDMSSVTLMLLPLSIPDFLKTSSRSLYSSNVTINWISNAK